MRIASNAHTHTTWCDGANTPREMVEAALQLGFVDLGFSGHSPASFDPTCPGVKSEIGYIDELNQLKSEYAAKINIAVGIEQDYFAPVAQPARYDYVIGAVHYVQKTDGTFVPVDGTPHHLLEVRDEMFGGDGIEMARAFYELTAQNVRHNHPQVVAHFDLIVKHNQNNRLFDENDPRYRDIALQALDAVADELAAYGGIVEVNTGGMARGYRDAPYPARFLLRHLQQRGMRVMLNSDSHTTRTLNYGFEEALALLGRLNFGSVAVLERGEFVDKTI